jgi:hypothetical protein
VPSCNNASIPVTATLVIPFLSYSTLRRRPRDIAAPFVEAVRMDRFVPNFGNLIGTVMTHTQRARGLNALNFFAVSVLIVILAPASGWSIGLCESNQQQNKTESEEEDREE